MYHKVVMSLGALLGIAVATLIDTAANIWVLLVYFLCAWYIDSCCVAIIVRFAQDFYHVHELTNTEREQLENLLALALPSVVAAIVLRIRQMRKYDHEVPIFRL